MKGYRIHIWKSVRHNGEFSHNLQSVQIVHAYNEKEARTKIRELEPPRHIELTNGLVIDTEEWVYEVEYLGRVRRRTVYEYEK